MKKGHVVFDLDGTIVHSSPIYPPMIEGFCAEMHLPCDIQKVVEGYTAPLEKDMGWGIPLKEQPAMYKLMETYHVNQMRMHHRFVPELFTGMDDIITELSEDFHLSLITVNTRAVAEEFLDQYNLKDYFTARRTLCCAQERNYGIKPSADAFYCLVRENGIDVSKAVMIGDSASDVGLAYAAGIPSIAVLWALSSTEKVMNAKPTLAIAQPEQLKPAIYQVLDL